MKYLIITAVREFEKDIKAILKTAGVNGFTFMEVTGHRDPSDEPLQGNWFASDKHEVQSLLFYVMAKNKNVDLVFEGIKIFNEAQASGSRVHVAMFNVEKSNES